jgi:hypothetical protein
VSITVPWLNTSHIYEKDDMLTLDTRSLRFHAASRMRLWIRFLHTLRSIASKKVKITKVGTISEFGLPIRFGLLFI